MEIKTGINEISDVKQKSEEISEADARLQVLQKMMLAIHSSLDLEKVFKQITDTAIYSMRYTTAIITVLNEEKKRFEIKSISTKKRLLPQIDKILGFSLKNLTIPADRAINPSIDSVMKGRVVVIKDLAEMGYPLISKSVCQAIQKFIGTKNGVLVPLKKEGGMVGAIFVSSPREEVPEDELTMIQNFAVAATQAIKNAELHTQTMQVEEALRESESKFKNLFEQAKDAVFIADAQTGILVDVNSAACNMLGLPKEKIEGMHQTEIHPPELVEQYTKIFRDHVEKGIAVTEDLVVQRADGSRVPVDISASVIELAGKPIIQGVFRDITERKQVEEKQRVIIKTALDGFWLVDLEGRFLEVNDSYCKMIGYTREELLEMSIPDVEAIEEPEETFQRIEKIMKEGSDRFETRHRCKDGKIIDVEVSVNYLDVGQGQMFVFVRDITERKQVEEVLRDSKEFIETVFESVHDSIAIIGAKNYEIVAVNKAFLNALNVEEKDVIGKHCYEITHGSNKPCEPPNDRCPLAETLKTGNYSSAEHIHHDEHGRQLYIEVSTSPIKNERGEIQGVIHVTRDITERKRAEEQLKESEERYRTVIEGAHDMIQSVAPDGSIRFANRAWRETLGYTDTELSNLNLYQIIHPDSLPHCQELFAKVMNGEAVHDIQANFLTKDGRNILVEGSATPRFIDDEVVATQAILRDITERKKMEEALQESRKFNSSLLENSPHAVVVINPDTSIRYVNPAWEELNGWTLEETIGMKAPYPWWSEEIREEMHAGFMEAMKQGSGTGEVISQKKNGELYWLALNWTSVMHNGEFQYLLVNSIDITERKRVEEALRESEEKLQRIFESVNDGITVTDLNGVIVDVNEKALQLSGFSSKNELVGKSSLESIAAYDRERAIVDMQQLAQQGIVGSAEYMLIRADGSEYPAEISANVLKDASDNLVGFVSVIRDITERKQATEALRESEEKFSTAFRSSPVSISITKLKDGTFIEINDSFTRDTGYTREEVIGRASIELGIWVKADDRVKMLHLLEEQGRINNEEFEFRVKSGEIRTWLFSAEIIYVGGEPCIIVMTTDITERKQAEEALESERQNFRNSMDNSPLGIMILNPENQVLYCNQAYLDMYGYSHVEEFSTIPPEQRFTPESLAKIGERMEMREVGKVVPSNYEMDIVRKDGEIRNMVVFRRELIWNGEKQYQTIWQDITERKQAEEALVNEATRRRILVDGSTDGIVVLDQDGKVYEANQRFAEMLGYSSEEVLELDVLDWEFLFPPEQTLDMIRTVDEAGDHFETQHRRKDGTIYDVEISTNAAFFAGEKLIFCVCRDITERKRAEQALEAEQQNFRNSMDNSPLGILILNDDNQLLYCNQASLDIWGYSSTEELINSPREQRFTPESIVKMDERTEQKKAGKPVPSSYEMDIVRKNGEIRNMMVFRREVIWNGEKQFQTLWQDITERKKAQDQLIVTDRLASVGELAAGVAHELNNPLTSVIGFSQLLLGREVPEDVKEDVRIICSEAQRTAAIVKNLLTFARKHTPVKQLVSINSTIEQVLQLRAYEQRVNNIRVSTHFEPEMPEVMADFFQLQQVFLNIVINAEHFMIEANRGGTLTVTTEKVGGIVKASFTDDGPGVSKDDLGHLFDPFFTTKEVGKGTGLGLSICHGIITEHGGRIYVESELGKGATFIVELPTMSAV